MFCFFFLSETQGKKSHFCFIIIIIIIIIILVLKFSFQKCRVPPPSGIKRYTSDKIWTSFLSSPLARITSEINVICLKCHFCIWLIKTYYPVCSWFEKSPQQTCTKGKNQSLSSTVPLLLKKKQNWQKGAVNIPSVSSGPSLPSAQNTLHAQVTHLGETCSEAL
ncbi:hypothetical protein HJG60_011465 [Phyllostomus discolor]|uniref:Uncharacterized protein n=1 Tax=Phyllostomus discolor TaxID=89673 RepID=A0A833ZTP9_9CHIR|nr:hypothetical protein HJG60_011465 [Phyllostomus discolor]